MELQPNFPLNDKQKGRNDRKKLLKHMENF